LAFKNSENTFPIHQGKFQDFDTLIFKSQGIFETGREEIPNRSSMTHRSHRQQDEVVARWPDSYQHTFPQILEEDTRNFLIYFFTCNYSSKVYWFSSMKNKMTTPLGTTFSTNKKVVSQCDDRTLESTAEILVIYFDREKFEQLLSMGNTSPCACKRRKISLAKALLANSWKQVSVETSKALCEPIAISSEAIQAPWELTAASNKANLALREPIN